ncbi:WecB/TagA/CpsF family glycosyltransferase [Nitrosococcus halophilus]|uniref:WecB/TagA/CpsF family glycosyltransferase n=1 Tax=Nitrosococcus halophilus TaxID=133539 RepID=UPI0013895F92|nr:WecB/TagA/CpsF family glycosyltransferase [Nitrosococcus halophilus]
MKTKILGVSYDNIDGNAAVQRFLALMESSGKSNIFFLNADCLWKSRKDKEYRDILNQASLLLPDGVGLRLATRIFGSRMRDNCNGTDLSPVLMKIAAKKGYKIYFLGGRNGIADQAAENMRRRIPGIKITGSYSGYFDSDKDVIERINTSGAEILFVAMGVPLQEKWISHNREWLEPRVCLGVGALLDYLSGQIPRAPLWMRQLWIEWIWRILVDPKRMVKRYLIDGFGFIVFVIWRRIMGKV